MADLADKAQAQTEWLDEYRIRSQRKKVMRASDYCIDCQEMIEAARLKAAPYATRCIYCQTEAERMDRQYL